MDIDGKWEIAILIHRMINDSYLLDFTFFNKKKKEKKRTTNKVEHMSYVLLSLAVSSKCVSDCCLMASEQCVQQHNWEIKRATFDKAMIISDLWCIRIVSWNFIEVARRNMTIAITGVIISWPIFSNMSNTYIQDLGL